jgi:tetratricopeptide (TPR) repeat protein
MNSAHNSLTCKAFIIALLVCCAVSLTLSSARAQDPTTYTEEQYKMFQDLQAEPAAAKKVAAAVKFLQANPKSGLRPNVIAECDKVMQDLEKSGNWAQITTYGQQIVSVAPEDSYSVGLLAQAYQQQKNYGQFVVFGEKVFAARPNAGLANMLAKAYQDLGNDAKFATWAEKSLSMNPDDPDIAIELAKRYAAAKRTAEATKYANMGLKALQGAKKPANVADDKWKQVVDQSNAQCYAIIGNSFYENKNYAQAIANLEKSVVAYKRNDVAYYFLGMSYWQMGKSGEAMLNFAKSFVLKGSTAAASKQYLDNLYRAGQGRGSLAGEERVLGRAKMDLGIQ